MLYTVVVADYYSGGSCGPQVRPVSRHDRVTLTHARRIAERAARRGLKLWGGRVVRFNWGTSGGQGGFQHPYRSATITVAA